MGDNEVFCDEDGTEIAEWSCYCVFPLKKICRLHVEEHLSEPLQPDAFHYFLPISATKIITTPDIFREKKPWVFGLMQRQIQLGECLGTLSRFPVEMNTAFQDLQRALSDRQEQIIDKVYREFESEVQTAIEETSRHALEAFDPAPGLQTLVWSEETQLADFPAFNWRIETNSEYLDGAFTTVVNKAFPENHHTSLTFGNLELFQQELDKLKAQLAKEVEEHKNEVHTLNMKYQEDIARRGENEALIEELNKIVTDTVDRAENYKNQYFTEKKNTETQINDLQVQLETAKEDAEKQKAVALQWKEWYNLQQSAIVESRKEMQNAKKDAERQKLEFIQWEEQRRQQQLTIDDLRTELQNEKNEVKRLKDDALEWEEVGLQHQLLVNDLTTELQNTKKEAEAQKAEALQLKEQYKQQQSTIDDLKKQLENVKKDAETQEIPIVQLEAKTITREKPRLIDVQRFAGQAEKTGSKVLVITKLRRKNPASRFPAKELTSSLSLARKSDLSGKKSFDEEFSMNSVGLGKYVLETPPPSASYRIIPSEFDWKCSRCEEPNKQDNPECFHCGTRRDLLVTTSQDLTRKCRRCQRNRNPSEEICSTCRTKSLECWTCPTCEVENTSWTCSKCGRHLDS